MSCRRLSKYSLLIVWITAITASLVGFGASPALADRCEPDELVVRIIDPDYESPDDPADPYVCGVTQTILYDNADCDDTTLMKCLQTLNVVGTYNNVYEKVLPGTYLVSVYMNPEGALCIAFTGRPPMCTDDYVKIG